VAPPPVAGGAAPGGGPGAGGASAGTGEAVGPVNLNTASAEELDTLPGVGPATSAAIIAHRQEHGPFTSVDQLLDVRGIGDAKLAELRDLVTV
jgi:competence protein ComEA